MANCCSNGSCSVTPATLSANKTDKISQKGPITRAVISFVLLIGGITMSATNISFFENQWVRLVWYLIAYFPVGIPVLKEAWEAMKEKDIFNEFTLMSIATIGAFFIGEYPEGVAVMLFYSIGELFQQAAVNRAKRNIGALLDVRPEKASVIRDNGIETVLSEEVSVGETVEVKVGERVPLDGIMLTDSGSFNTSALTGESVPRNIKKEEEVLAGMIATDSVCRIKVTRPFGQSALARILELVQNATERKAPAEQFIRKFARIYTPVVTMLAVLIVVLPWMWSLIDPEFMYLFNDWLYRGLVFLVISCPCALVISIPLGYFGGIGAASRQGILFKGGNYLDAITRINTVVLDKTGTVTKGVFEVQDIIPEEGFSKEELLHAVAIVETQSNHPIAKAIVSSVPKERIPFAQPVNVKEVAGQGLEAELDGKKILAGNMKLLETNGIAYPPEVADIPETTVLCAVDGKYAGYIVVADELKEDAKVAVEELRKAGIKDIVMLSGDKQAIVSKLAGELGIDRAYGDLLPEGKVQRFEELSINPGNKVSFVGDGINDAPVLAMSDVGIAMGGLGSDVAIETADVVIQTDQPVKIPMAIRIGKATRQIVIQNITMAFGVKLIVLILGAGGLATLWEAVFADVGVSLLAILNAIRIMRKKF
ncbi:Cadmium, zinc and cobalt-transporting ATPase [Proteiniphilum saccharofermentans]|uniref:P-type Zn(2+) transporter n=1 Tax=Proteiniphilum saccharofermentans TaxID=1642647 RepID=A0A1R3SVF6_9BACT|nr:Cadmium, zinc and cobalt-transporting ATPase [Proteiniphilum saccharofermentans]